MTIQEWIDGYAQAWRDKDSDAAADLFTETATYVADPFGEAHVGPDGVRDYWSGVTATQEELRVLFGSAIASADARRAAVEFWVTMVNGGTELTLTGILFLRFDAGGRCEELRETWNIGMGRSDPPAAWGS
jgi:hypothetical protein